MKKKVVNTVVALMLCAALLIGCGQKIEDTLPEDLPMDLIFSSGVGAWSTALRLERDGTFSGEHHDSDMGVDGEDHPNGTIYICDFSGRFSELEKVDKYSYSLTLAEISSDYEVEKEWIEDGVRYVSSAPYGMEEGDEFILYLPDTPIDGLDEEFLSWWQCWVMYGEQTGTLEMYGLYNIKMGYGFFG